MTHAFSGTVPLDGLEGGETLTVGLTDTLRIEMSFLTDEGRHTYPIAFDDAEHLAALLRDLALIVRTKVGLGMTEVE